MDDQRAIVESLKNGICWEKLGIDKVLTAGCAKEAKLVLVNFDVDILLTDIEMPEEDGLELFCWTKERFPDIVGIFLTSHADFSYAREAIRLGGFDYILQPARYEDVEEVLGRAVKKLEQNHRIHKMERTTKLMTEQRDSLMELMTARFLEGKTEELSTLFGQLKSLLSVDYQDCVFWELKVQILKFKHFSNQWSEELLKLVFRNVLEELFVEENARACISALDKNAYLVFVAVERGTMINEKWHQGMNDFLQFLNNHMDYTVALYPQDQEMDTLDMTDIQKMIEREKSNATKHAEILWEDVEPSDEMKINEERIKIAVEYIHNNISKSISRTDVANLLHLNEEYFTRLFKQYTGYTFKDYEMMGRMNQAKNLLEHSKLSISIVASKVGYDNFSHFSKTFKKMTGFTPQEYRKQYQK